MLSITIPDDPDGYWDEEKEEFITVKGGTLILEHSLLSIVRWESKWHKSFLSDRNKKTDEEMADYVRCMTINNVDPSLYQRLTPEDYMKIRQYIDDPMSATYIAKTGEKNNGIHDTPTAEVLYWQMIQCNIPIEIFEKRHLNQLIALIHVCEVKGGSNKMSEKELMQRNRALNNARRARHKTRG